MNANYPDPNLFPVEDYARFTARWQNHWYGEGRYVGSGLPFRVVTEIAKIEGRAAWDRRLPINYQMEAH